MSTSTINGAGGGHESQKTTASKVFLITFFKRAREIIKNVDIEIHNEYSVPCPPEYNNEEGKRYQSDLAIIIPGFPQYSFLIEIDGKVGHNFKTYNILNKTTTDDIRDAWIYHHHKLPIFRLKLDWLIQWDKKDNYEELLDELTFQHKRFKHGKLPKNPLIHLAKRKGVFR